MPRGRSKQGGYQPPAKPAAVSLPGAGSQRTDSPATQPIRVPTGGDFGDRQALVAQQQAAPLAAAGGQPPAPAAAPIMQGPQPGSLTPLDAPTNRPGEPLTTGLPMGPGAGPEVLGMVDGPGSLLRSIYKDTADESIRELIEALDEGR